MGEGGAEGSISPHTTSPGGRGEGRGGGGMVLVLVGGGGGGVGGLHGRHISPFCVISQTAPDVRETTPAYTRGKT